MGDGKGATAPIPYPLRYVGGKLTAAVIDVGAAAAGAVVVDAVATAQLVVSLFAVDAVTVTAVAGHTVIAGIAEELVRPVAAVNQVIALAAGDAVVAGIAIEV